MEFVSSDERELCKIDCESCKSGRRKGDTVLLTDRRVYCEWTNPAGMRAARTIDLREVSAVECGSYGFVRYPVLGLAFLLLTGILAAALSSYRTRTLVWTAVGVLLLGAAFLAVCLVAYFTRRMPAVVLYYGPHRLRLSAPGLEASDMSAFCGELFSAKDRLCERGRMKSSASRPAGKSDF